jgi:tRNA(fMet)-specific endonuclease VapC
MNGTAVYMLDTNIASAFIRGGHPRLEEQVLALPTGGWCISAITRSELRFGVELLRPHATRLERIVDAFLDAAPAAPWDRAAADMHARVRARLQNAGTPIGAFDEMIAAHALALDVVLVTDNERHFHRVEGLAVENWIRSRPSHPRPR